MKYNINLSERKKDKYEYLKSLGYSEEQALTLSIATYNTPISIVIEEFNKKLIGKQTFCEFMISTIDRLGMSESDIEDSELLYFILTECIKLGSKANNKTLDFFKKEHHKIIKKQEAKLTERFSQSLFAGMAKASRRGGMEFGAAPMGMMRMTSYDAADCMMESAVCGCDCIELDEEVSVDGELTPEFIIDTLRSDKYQHIEEKGFNDVSINPTSTIRTNCNTASIDIVRNQIRNKLRVEKSSVRIEELLNYFNYKLNSVADDRYFSVTSSMCDKKGSNSKYLMLGIKGKEIIPDKQNVVLLLDVSGSMGGNTEVTQLTLLTLISKLNDNDKLSLITYSSSDETVIDDITYNKDFLDDIIVKILSIKIFGCTYGSKGLESAYELVNRNKIDTGINRVVIITDGDFNFGNHSNDSLQKQIAEHKKTGAYLSVIGTGTWNINDHLMETLAKNGNGNYCTVNNLDDVKENINSKYAKLMFTIATDVKAQVEFNPKYVESYRLIGYENRTLNHNEFRDDNVIAEPYGSGSYSVALYEITIPNNKKGSKLKYQTSEIVDSDEICTVYVRYKKLNTTEAIEEETAVNYNDAIESDEYNAKLASAIAIKGEKLRNSEFITEKDMITALEIIDEYKDDEMNISKICVLKEL